jgi:hypothetical protein
MHSKCTVGGIGNVIVSMRRWLCSNGVIVQVFVGTPCRSVLSSKEKVSEFRRTEL